MRNWPRVGEKISTDGIQICAQKQPRACIFLANRDLVYDAILSIFG